MIITQYTMKKSYNLKNKNMEKKIQSKLAIAVSKFKYVGNKITKKIKDFKRHFEPQCKNYPLCDLYNVKQFAAKTGLPYSTIIYWCKRGRIKTVQVSPNSSWLIHSSELQRILKAREKGVR